MYLNNTCWPDEIVLNFYSFLSFKKTAKTTRVCKSLKKLLTSESIIDKFIKTQRIKFSTEERKWLVENPYKKLHFIIKNTFHRELPNTRYDNSQASLTFLFLAPSSIENNLANNFFTRYIRMRYYNMVQSVSAMYRLNGDNFTLSWHEWDDSHRITHHNGTPIIKFENTSSWVIASPCSLSHILFFAEPKLTKDISGCRKQKSYLYLSFMKNTLIKRSYYPIIRNFLDPAIVQ